MYSIRSHLEPVYDQIHLLANIMNDATLDRSIVIDDDQTYLLDVVRNAFSENAFNIFFARNGEEALNYINTKDNIVLLVLDHVMDLATGLEVLKCVRTGRTAAPSDLPTLLVTGYSDAEVVRLARALDVSSVLTKPVSLKVISERLHHVLSHPIATKSPDAYEAIDVSPTHTAEPAARRSPGIVMTSNNGPHWRRPSAPRKPVGPFRNDRSIWIKLANIRAGMVIAQDVCASNGMLIVADGVELTGRLIERLNGHSQTMTDLAYLKIYDTPAARNHDPENGG